MSSSSSSSGSKKPIISQHNNNNEFSLTFTLENCDVSVANALRRIIVSDVNQYVFRTFPHSENRAEFTVNTTRLHNEILKQRLGCIPIHHLHTVDGFANEYKNYVVEVDVKNETDTIRYVTTEDFKVKKAKAIEKKSGDADDDVVYQYLPEATVRKIFPPDAISGEYIEFARLLPNLSSSNSNSGESLAFTCTLEISNAKFDGMYNVAHTCAYNCTPDTKEIDKQWRAKEKLMREGLESSSLPASSIEEVVENAKKNWELLDAARIFVPNSFDFIIETVGVYTNVQLVTKACDIMIKKCEKLLADIEHAAGAESDTNATTTTTTTTTTIEYAHELTTMKNSFRINLIGEDYTLGKVIENYIFSNYYNKSDGIVSFCGFKKPHPHALDSYIIVSFKEEIELSKVQEHISKVILESISVFKSLFDSFNDFKSKK